MNSEKRDRQFFWPCYFCDAVFLDIDPLVEHLKKEYERSHFGGGMWDISDRASGSLWKATLLLFAGLLGLVAFILWSR